MLQAFIHWNPDPTIVALGPVTLRWYGVLFMTGFALGYWVTARMFKAEKAPSEWLDWLLLTMIFGALIGARLGHVFFYNWAYYQDHPAEIPMIWKGGLASHGASVTLLLGLWLFSKLVSKKPMSWVMDRMAVSIPLGGGFIRLGNLMNSEILGSPTEQPWGFIFGRLGEPFARHPAQLYESLTYFAIFGVLLWLYWRTGIKDRPLALSGWFMVLVFGARFVLEFWKEKQEVIENESLRTFLDPLTMGQWLSIPLVLLGIGMLIYAYRKPAPAAG